MDWPRAKQPFASPPQLFWSGSSFSCCEQPGKEAGIFIKGDLDWVRQRSGKTPTKQDAQTYIKAFRSKHQTLQFWESHWWTSVRENSTCHTSFSYFQWILSIQSTLFLRFIEEEVLGFPSGPVVKNLPVNAGDSDSIPRSGRSPRGGNGNPLQYSCLENPMDRGAWRVTKSRTQLSTRR